MDEKEEHDDVEADYIVDEKARSATLTPSGIAKAEAFFQIENLSDPDNAALHHHNQAIRARGIMQRDVDYVVREGQIIIVDEFTGRLMSRQTLFRGCTRPLRPGARQYPARKQNPRDDYVPELFQAVFETFGYDGYRFNRGRGI